MGARPYLARTEYEYGRARLAHGDRARARELIESARAAAAELGMTGLVRLADAKLAEISADSASSNSLARESSGPVAPESSGPLAPESSGPLAPRSGERVRERVPAGGPAALQAMTASRPPRFVAASVPHAAPMSEPPE